MDTVRFTKVVKDAGKPEVYLLWKTPSKDAALRKLVTQHRVMTLMQPRVGTKKDWGEVGLGKKLDGQILVFPRSLKKAEGKRVVGIDYRLMKELPLAPKRPVKKVAKPQVKPRMVEPPEPPPEPEESKEPPPKNIIHLPLRARTEKEQTRTKPPNAAKNAAPRPAKKKKAAPMSDALLQRKAKAALTSWKSGNQLPAFELIQRLAENEGSPLAGR